MRILFISTSRRGTFHHFDYSDLEAVRGAESTTLHLAAALAARGHSIVLATGGVRRLGHPAGVEIAAPQEAFSRAYDAAISNNYARALDGANAPVKVVWTHNPGFSRRHIQADWLAKWRHRPHLVHLSQYTRARSWCLPSASQSVILHGMAPALLARRCPRAAPPPLAVFASYAGRNLCKAVAAWRAYVHPAMPDARLLVFAEPEAKHVNGLSAARLAALNIEVAAVLPWSKLMDRLQSARLLVVPGHFQETFNLLSIEAAACGTPSVSMGLGALRERIHHDQSGWLARSIPDMGKAISRLLTDDVLWARYHRACLAHPDLVSWDKRAAEWEELLENL